MVQKFVVEHDGGISVSSKQGMGTVFEIYLPIVETPIHA
jgi:signal transduction histidine kinase